MNILIVEDEKLVAHSIKNIFLDIAQVNIIHTAYSFEDAYNKTLSHNYDIILIDIFLGDENGTGIDLCKLIRKYDNEVILICITGMKSSHYLEEAFQSGVNDYITKPFIRKEVELRVMRWKKLRSNIQYHEKIEYNNLEYSIDENVFYFNNHRLELTRKNKELLLLFLKKPEQLLSKTYIQEKLWGDHIELDNKSRNIRSNIQILKKYLEGYCDDWIKTVRGEGYILKAK